MKIVTRIVDDLLILSASDFELISEIVKRSEVLDEEHVGKGLGSTGYEKSYLPKIAEPKTGLLRVDILDDETYDSYKALTMMRENAKK